MHDAIVVPVSELVSQTATRARGREAFTNLVARLRQTITERTVVIVDLSSATMVTGSFIDELILRAAELPKNLQLAFRVASEDDYTRIEKVCAMRAARCICQVGETGSMRRTKKIPGPRSRPQSYSGAFFST